MKVREAIKLIQADDWYLARTKGSHRQFKHPTKSGLVTVAGKPSNHLAPGTLNSLLKQAQCKKIKQENKSHALCHSN
jgi:predicted RNA binding protein YcfA (HicA-like mRNA interferase family)